MPNHSPRVGGWAGSPATPAVPWDCGMPMGPCGLMGTAHTGDKSLQAKEPVGHPAEPLRQSHGPLVGPLGPLVGPCVPCGAPLGLSHRVVLPWQVRPVMAWGTPYGRDCVPGRPLGPNDCGASPQPFWLKWRHGMGVILIPVGDDGQAQRPGQPGHQPWPGPCPSRAPPQPKPTPCVVPRRTPR